MSSPLTSRLQASADNISNEPNEQPSHILQEYLRADPTVSELCSGAIEADKPDTRKNSRSHEVKKQMENLDKIWAGSPGSAK